MKAIEKWLAGYVASILRRPRSTGATRHLLFCVADHFEPFRGGVPAEKARNDVKTWVEEFRSAAAPRYDADGGQYKRTLFYPAEEYDEQCVGTLAQLCRDGLAEVEIHLHHRNDTEDGFRRKLVEFRDILHTRHGLLGLRNGQPAFGFVHGNWALCNSRPDGDWCGVNSELGILHDAGCYADFTFPSAPSPTQPRMVNAIYRAMDTGRPGAADEGERVKAESRKLTVEMGRGRRTEDRAEKDEGGDLKPESGIKANELFSGTSSLKSPWPARGRQVSSFSQSSALMLITGPLGLNWKSRKWGVLPRLENGEWSESNPPSACRADLWVKQGIHVAGRPEWIFVKVHTHGMANGVMERDLLEYLERRYNDGVKWKLHYVSAREMYNIARAAEDGHEGEPGGFREYEVSSKQ